MSALLPLFLAFLVLALSGCTGSKERRPAAGEAYAGAATVNLRKEIPLQSPVVTTVKFGERLEIIGHRRRFYKVRTASDAEGWTDERLLLSPEELAGIQKRAKEARSLPSQGIAGTYELLNVHTEPDRQSPSAIQIREGEKVEVLAHQLVARTSKPRKPLVGPAVRTPAPAKKRKPPKYQPPPLPKAPAVPANWLELSKTPPEVAAEIQNKQPPPVPMDDWALIRTAKGESGWVLTRRIYLAIPDEVAQYAEGHRITSYFSLGEVRDGDSAKHNWLWTTIAQGLQPYDFDSFRVFIWSLRRHRYETAYIERNLTGYFPVLAHPVELATAAKGRGAAAKTTYPGFSVCIEKRDGQRYRRSYAFIGNIVRFAGERPCEVAPRPEDRPSAPGLVASAQTPEPGREEKNLLDRFKGQLHALRKRWLGR